MSGHYFQLLPSSVVAIAIVCSAIKRRFTRCPSWPEKKDLEWNLETFARKTDLENSVIWTYEIIKVNVFSSLCETVTVLPPAHGPSYFSAKTELFQIVPQTLIYGPALIFRACKLFTFVKPETPLAPVTGSLARSGLAVSSFSLEMNHLLQNHPHGWDFTWLECI